MNKSYTVLRTFTDSESGEKVRAGDTITPTPQRAAQLHQHGLIGPNPIKEVTKSVPSKLAKAAVPTPAKGKTKMAIQNPALKASEGKPTQEGTDATGQPASSK